MLNLKGSNNYNIFTQPIDESYSNQLQHFSSENYYSYEGCNIVEIDKILNKSKLSSNEEEDINDNSTNGIFSEEDILKAYGEEFKINNLDYYRTLDNVDKIETKRCSKISNINLCHNYEKNNVNNKESINEEINCLIISSKSKNYNTIDSKEESKQKFSSFLKSSWKDNLKLLKTNNIVNNNNINYYINRNSIYSKTSNMNKLNCCTTNNNSNYNCKTVYGTPVLSNSNYINTNNCYNHNYNIKNKFNLNENFCISNSNNSVKLHYKNIDIDIPSLKLDA